MSGGPIVGIDLGTTNSVVAHMQGRATRVLADDQGFKIQPSVVSFHPNGGVLVGSAAKQRRVIDPSNTVYSAKRLIGRTFQSQEVTEARQRAPYKIKEGLNQQPVIVTRAGEFAIPEISAIIIDHMRSIAGAGLGEDVNRAVVTVPANFTDAQRSATATAGAIAGVTVIRVLNEPTAAALAYGHGRAGLEQTVAVYDFGGGTFDVTLLRLENDVYEVLSTAGDSFLGGDDIDEILVQYMVQQFLEQNRTDLQHDQTAMQRLRAVAEQTKIELSRRSRAIVKVDELAYGAGGNPLDLEIRISRDEFLAKVAPVVDRTFPVCQEALRAAGVKPDKVDEVVLVGGTTKMPYVRERVAAFFSRPPRTDLNPDEAVAIGSAIQADAMAQVLGQSPRATAQRSVAPPPPPMETRPAGTPRPPPPPADAIAARLAPGPKMTRPRVATRDPITAGAQADGDFPDMPTIPGDEHPTHVAEPPSEKTRLDEGWSVPAEVPQAPAPPPIPGAPSAPPVAGIPLARTPAARITRPGPAPARPSEPRAVVDDAFAVDTSAGTAIRDDGPGPDPDTGITHERPGASDTGVTHELRSDRETGFDLDRLTADNRAPSEDDLSPSEPLATLGGEARLAAEPPTVPHQPGPPGIGSGPMRARPAGGEAPAPGPRRTAFLTPVQPVTTAPEPEPGPRTVDAASAADSALDVLGIGPGTSGRVEAVAAPVVLDVVPHTLGIGTVAGYCDEILRRNTHVPCEETRSFATSKDGQLEVRVRICQGESRRLAENTLLGEVVLSGLDPRPRGRRIEVTFRIDASGMLEVAARDEETGRERQASVNLLGAQSSEEVEAARARMQRLRG